MLIETYQISTISQILLCNHLLQSIEIAFNIIIEKSAQIKTERCKIEFIGSK